MKKLFLILLIIASITVMMIPHVSAFGEVKEYTKEPQEKYGTITIYDWYKLPIISGKQVDYKLTEVTESIINLKMEGIAIIYFDNTLFDDTIYKNLAGKNTNVKKEKYYIEVTKDNYIEYPDRTEQKCEEILNKNTSKMEEVCHEEVISYKQVNEPVKIWQEYKGESLKAGTYKWKWEGYRNINEKVDVIPVKAGIEFKEWTWYDTNWLKKQQINISGGQAQITDGIIYLNITYDGDMQTDFDDIRFTESTETSELSYELDYKVDGSFAGYWIKIPTLNAGYMNNTIYMYYNNAGATTTSNGANTFSDYMSVFHFSEGTGITIKDSGYKSGNMTCKGTGGSWLSGNNFGKAYSTNGILTGGCNSTGKVTYSLGTGNRTVIMFEKINTAAADKFIVSLGDNAGSAAKIMLGGSEASNTWYFEYNSGSDVWGTNTYNLNNNMLIHSYDGTSTSNFLYNSTTFVSQTAVKSLDAGSNQNLSIGYRQPSSSISNVTVDEIRLANKTFTSAYLNRTYQNTNFSNFVFGAEQDSTVTILTTTLSYPANNTNYTITTIGIGCNFTATLQNITSVKLNVYDSSNNLDYTNTDTANYGVSYNKTWTTTALTDDTYKWHCIGYGDGGVNGTTANRTFTIDTTAPEISIIYPTATNYSTNVSVLNFTASDTNAGVCNMTVSTGATNTSILNYGINFTVISSSEGSNIWTLTCNDSFGNINSSTVTFFKDTVYPLIEYGIGTNDDGAFISYRNIYINTTWTEINPSNVQFIANGPTSVSASGLVKFYNFTTGLSDGFYLYNVTICDTVGNCNTTGTRNITLDTIAPKVDIVLPTATNYNVANTELNFTATDTNPQNCWMTVDVGTANDTIQNFYENFSSITSAEGDNTWKAYCNDTAGNQNYSTVTFFQDTVFPLIDWDANGNKASGTVTTGYTIPMNVTLTETNFKNITYRTSEPRTDVFTTAITFNSNVVLTGDGIYYYNVTACDTVGNCNQTSTRNITFDNVAPSIRIVSPTGSYNIPPSDNVSLNYIATDLTPLTCWYSRNGQANISLASCANASVEINQLGWNTWTVYVNDSAGHLTYNSTTFHALGSFYLCNDTATQLSMNFSTYDEETLLPVNESTFSGNVFYYVTDINYNQTYIFNNYSGLDGNFNFCIYPNWVTMKTSFDSQYSANGYPIRNYQTLGAATDNVTDAIPLYLLNSSLTGYKILVVKILDSNLVVQKNIAVQLLRYYPSTNTWVNVEHDVSDELGQTIFHVIENTVNYKFILSQDGAIVYTTDTVKVVCYATPCSIELTIPSSADDVFKYYSNASGVSYTLSSDNNTDVVTFIYSSIDGSSKTTQLYVRQDNISGNSVICNNLSTGTSGVLTCNLSGMSGSYSAQAYVNTTSGYKIIDRISISLQNFFKTTGVEGLFWAILMIITLVFVGIWNPTVSLILMMTGFIALAITGIISLPWFALASVIIMGGYIIYSLKT